MALDGPKVFGYQFWAWSEVLRGRCDRFCRWCRFDYEQLKIACMWVGAISQFPATTQRPTLWRFLTMGVVATCSRSGCVSGEIFGNGHTLPRISRPVRAQSSNRVGLKQVIKCDILLFSNICPKSNLLIKNEPESCEIYSHIIRETLWTVGSKL